jgi:hypothetical protein
MSDEIRGTIFVTVKRPSTAPGGAEHITFEVPIDAKNVSKKALSDLEKALTDWAKRNKVKVGRIKQKRF